MNMPQTTQFLVDFIDSQIHTHTHTLCKAHKIDIVLLINYRQKQKREEEKIADTQARARAHTYMKIGYQLNGNKINIQLQLSRTCSLTQFDFSVIEYCTNNVIHIKIKRKYASSVQCFVSLWRKFWL